MEIAAELFDEPDRLVIVGIAGSGMVIAEKIRVQLSQLTDIDIQVVSCKLNKKKPEEIAYSDDINFNGKNVLVVDDVTNSGRTLLYSIKPLLQFQPKRIQTLSLVERMHKSFPVKIDYIGLSVATTLKEHITVEVENGEVIGAYIQ